MRAINCPRCRKPLPPPLPNPTHTGNNTHSKATRCYGCTNSEGVWLSEYLVTLVSSPFGSKRLWKDRQSGMAVEDGQVLAKP